MAKRISLREFQQDLSNRLAGTKNSTAKPALLAVLAGGEGWLVDLTDTGEILAVPPIAPVPLTHEWFRGLANVRGNLFSVVDFPAFIGLAPVVSSSESRLLLIGSRLGINTALLVSRAIGLRNPDDFEVDPRFQDPRPWVASGLRDSQDRLWKRLSVRHLLGDSRFLDAAHIGH
ncbi:chemotaxis protein CheW [Niveibacterium sp. 24ML]|uniref:chemotaxis protein CheW n=1 Tax=Niveibacterium sp. 24ML TaxID=2985512 RepID=UPI002271BAAF|nr:chemotaxis protein CheW [Niveibacterium sp. 24ML]MCX9155801.1 chemotaxis protein CheW [Niveibacterium sp. 24ML]